MKHLTVKRSLVSLLAVAAMSAFSLSAVGAQEVTEPTTPASNNNTITVSGLGSAYGEPDVAYIELGVEIVDANLATAFSQTSEQSNAVLAALTELGIDRVDIQTTSLNVYQEERYDPMTGATGERVYRVRNIVRITVRDTEQIETVINGAVNAGANTIYGLNFGILDVNALEETARLQAVENARSRAQQLASALGRNVGVAVNVREIIGGGNVIAYQESAFMGRGGAADMSVSQGQLQVTVQIEVTFTLE